MKKYVKPELIYEKIELTQHIADCTWELTSGHESTCSATADPNVVPGFPNMFINETNGCVLIPGQNYEEYCYFDGAQGANVFAS